MFTLFRNLPNKESRRQYVRRLYRNCALDVSYQCAYIFPVIKKIITHKLRVMLFPHMNVEVFFKQQ